MADTVHNAHQEFWRPPISQPETAASLAEACRRCGTEFMVGAAFCHVCGSSRHHANAVAVRKWTHYFGVLSLGFVRVKNWLGLPTLSFWAFVAGVAFLIAALAMGLVDTRDSTLNF